MTTRPDMVFGDDGNEETLVGSGSAPAPRPRALRPQTSSTTAGLAARQVAEAERPAIATTGPVSRSGAQSGDHLRPPIVHKSNGTRLVWVLTAAALLGIAIMAVWLALKSFPESASSEISSASPITLSDQKQLVDGKIAEAEALTASGDTGGAITRLREAIKLDPSSAESHRRLGDLLLKTGARRQAIDEFRALVQMNAADADAWRALADAQFAEELYADAAESYRRLISTGEADLDDNVRLSYADALRLAGRTEEARALYQRLALLPDEEIALAAQQQLDELPAPPTIDATPETEVNARAQPRRTSALKDDSAEPTIPLPASTPVLTPVQIPKTTVTVALSSNDYFNRGLALWGSNRASALNEFRAAARAGSSEARYYLGLSIAEGREPKTLKRAELLAALEHFQYAQNGKFGPQARRYVGQLDKEYGRRLLQKQP